MKIIENWWLSIDKINFILIISLGITGVILSFSANENFYYINRHSIFFIISIFLLVFFSQLGDKNIRRVSLVSFFMLIFILLLVFLLDFEIRGAKRWLKIFSFSIQPSEIIKPFFIILTAWCIAQTINSKKYYIILLFVFFAILLSFIILQPDFGMTILIATTFFCQLFVAGLPLLLVFVALGFLITMTISSYYLFDHVKKRISSFLDSGADTYQIDLSIKTFQSGGILGKGPGQGILKESIPEANTDFIFAVAGEELGYVFCLIIILIILSIIIRTLIYVLKIQDPYKMIAISGLICSFGLQSLINIFSSIGLIPTKGMTLPFVSYGGSSMISISILFGFLLSLTNKNNA